MKLLYQLADDIRRYPKVAIFGMLKAETVAMNLQSDLAMLVRFPQRRSNFRNR